MLTVLAALTPTTEEALSARTDAQTYVTRNVAHMDYPRFVAQQLPIGSGAVESACMCLVEARLKQASMRWGVSGSQVIAVQHAGRGAAFWQTHSARSQPPTIVITRGLQELACLLPDTLPRALISLRV